VSARPAIDVVGVKKTFGEGALAVPALRGVDFHVGEGELVMLAGPSGSGKTTLLSLMGCVLRPTAGSIRLFGEEVSTMPDAELPRLRTTYLGFVFQGGNLIASLTALENIVLQLELRGYDGAGARKEASAILDRVGLSDKLDRKPGDLSGGQRQRVAIARAIAGSPPLILADEPTASLDAENGLMVTQMLRDLARERGRTVVIVTHDNRIFHLADRIDHIEDGLMRAASEAA
jgi:putative ABC transport system ATP-binding protein